MEPSKPSRPLKSIRLFDAPKFKKLGFIEDDGQHPLKVNGSLLSVVLHGRA